MLKNYVKIARPDHWIKNVFMLPGILFALLYLTNDTLAFLEIDLKLTAVRLILATISLCLTASANYVINEYLDAKFDKYHPTKKDRIAVNEQLNPIIVYTEYFLLLILGLTAAWFCVFNFFIMAVFLVFMGVIYNVKPARTKDVPFLDVLSESVNNAIRLAMGWLIIIPDTFPVSSLI